MPVGPSPFETEFQNILPESGDNLHLRAAKVEQRLLTLEATPPGSVTAAQLIVFQGIVYDAPFGYVPENVANKSNDGTMAANSATFYPSQQAAKTYADTKQSALGFTPENVANKSIDGTFAANSDTFYPSQKAAKTYADTKLALTGGILSGDLDISTGIHLDSDGSASFGTGKALFSTAGDLSFSGVLHAGLRLNNLTTAQRDAIAAPTAGLLIWNTTTAAVNQYTGAAWAAVGGGGSSPPFSDATAILMGSADGTKLLRFEVDGFTTATTRVLTPQNASYTIAGLETAQTFTAIQTVGGITLNPDGSALFATGGVSISATGDFALGGVIQLNADGSALFANGGNPITISAAGDISMGGDVDLSTGIHLDSDGSASFGTGILTVLGTGAIVTTAGIFLASGLLNLQDSGQVDLGGGGQIVLFTDGSAQFATGAFFIEADGDIHFADTTIAGLRLNNLTTVQRDAIAVPLAGQLVFDTTAGAVSLYNGAAWTNLGNAFQSLTLAQFAATTSAQFATVISDETGTGLVVFNVNPTLQGAVFTGGVSFNSTTIAGLKVNNLTTTQRDALTPTAGQIIWNTTTARFEHYTGSSWKSFVRLDGDTMTGSLLFTDNSFDIGATGATRPRSIFVGTSLDVQRSAIGATLTDGVLLTNSTAAAAGAQQYSPAIRLTGQGWKTTATAASQPVDWRIYVVPVQGSTNPTATLDFDVSLNGGAFTNRVSITSAGVLTSTSSVAGGYQTSGSSDTYGFLSTRTKLGSSGDGLLELFNAAKTDFTRLNFGGTTSSFPAIARSGTSLLLQLADGTGNAGLTTGALTIALASALIIPSGTNKRAGNAVLVAGTVTVSNTTVTANSIVLLTRKTAGGTIGTSITYTLSAGASFTITSDNILDTSTFSFFILENP